MASRPRPASSAPGDRPRPELSADPDPAAAAGWMRASDALFLRRTLIVAGVVAVASALGLVLVFAFSVVLLLFAAILLAVGIRLPAVWLTNHTPLSERQALGLAILFCAALVALLGWMFAVPIADQFNQVSDELPQAVAAVRGWAEDYPLGRALLAVLGQAADPQQIQRLLSGTAGVLSSTLHAVAAVVAILFLGFYLAAQPGLYQKGFLRLLPRNRRLRAAEVLHELGHTLGRWLVARVLAMIAVGILAFVGLTLLGLPFALPLAVISALLEFVPYFGPVVSAVPAVLVGFQVSPAHAAYVVALYVLIQTAEGYLVSPLIEQRAVSLPPALVVFAAVLFGALWGAPGVALASPITAALMTVVRMLYVEDTLQQEPRR